jgi:hypothetical protein
VVVVVVVDFDSLRPCCRGGVTGIPFSSGGLAASTADRVASRAGSHKSARRKAPIEIFDIGVVVIGIATLSVY